MSDYTPLMPYRALWTQPLQGLAAHWLPKLILATVGTVLLEAVNYVLMFYGTLLRTDPLLVIAIFTLLVVDLVTGIAAARRSKRSITSRGVRATGRKAIEYFVLATVGVVLSNAFAENPLHYVTDGLDDAVMLFIALTEAFSIVENITGSRENAARLFRRLRHITTGQARTVEEIVVEVPLDKLPDDAPDEGDKSGASGQDEAPREG